MRLATYVLVALVFPVVGSAGEWPQWRGPGRNAVSTETDLLQAWPAEGPKLAWKASNIGAAYSSVVVSEGLVFTTGRIDGNVICHAIDLKSGKTKWSQPIGKTSRNVMSTPTVHDGYVYAVDPDGELVCLRASDGNIGWQRSFMDEFDGRLMSGRGYGESPLVDGDRLICTPGGADAMIVALDRRTGKDIWKSRIPDIGQKGRDGAAFSSIGISHAAGVRQYVQLVGRGLIGIDSKDGRFLWGYNDISNQTANIPTPIVHGDYVFSANGYHAGSVLLKIEKHDGTTGVAAREVYRLKGNRFQNHHGGFVLIGDHLFGGHGSNNGLPTCLDFMTGKIVWKRRGPGIGSASVVAAEGRLYFKYQDGTIALIEATSEVYRLVSAFQLPNTGGDSWAHPIIADRKLFIREKSELYAFDLRISDARQPTPTPTNAVAPEFAKLSELGAEITVLSAKGTLADNDLFRYALATEPLTIVRLRNRHFSDGGELDKQITAELQRVPTEFALNVAGTPVSADGLRTVSELKQLRGLSIELCEALSDEDLKPLSKAAELRVLIATGTAIGTDGLKHLQGLSNLSALDLEVCDNASDECCDILNQIDSLRALVLKKTAFEKKRFSSAGIQKLASLRNLEYLDLYANAISDETLDHLKPFPKLKHLDLSLTTVTDKGLEKLEPFETLQSLTLLYSEGFAGPTITNAGLKPLARIQQLEQLNLVGAKITDAGIDNLKSLKNLKRLTLVGTRISKDGVKRLQDALQDCEISLQ